MNPLKWLQDRDAAVRGWAGERAVAERAMADELRKGRQEQYVQDRLGRSAEDLGPEVASYFSRVPEAGSAAEGQYQQAASLFNSWRQPGMGMEDLSKLDPKDQALMQALGSLDNAKRQQLLGSMAEAQGPGNRERMRMGFSGVAETLARDDWQGATARTAAVSGVIGGSVMALTPAAQGLIALMDHMQQGQQNEMDREQPLA